MTRQNSEAVRIRKLGGEERILNSLVPSSYNRCSLPRLAVIMNNNLVEPKKTQNSSKNDAPPTPPASHLEGKNENEKVVPFQVISLEKERKNSPCVIKTCLVYVKI